MLNMIWAVMILLAVIYGAVTGHMADVTNAALDSAGEAISLCITMAGVVALWMGLMEIAQKAGLVRKLTNGIAPFLRFMFPRIPEGHPAREYIATNVIANVLGLGWACTPAGLKAMEELAKLEVERGNPEYTESKRGNPERLESERGNLGYLESERENPEYPEPAGGATPKMTRKRSSGRKTNMYKERRASNEMCIFLIINISSLQLIPVNMIAYRSQYGSANPAVIIAPAIAATLISTLTAIVYCKVKDCADKDHWAASGQRQMHGGSMLGRNAGQGQMHGGGMLDRNAGQKRMHGDSMPGRNAGQRRMHGGSILGRNGKGGKAV